MKIRQILGVALILALSGSLSLAHADVVGGGDPFTITFDENGNASYQVFDSGTGTYGPVVNDPGFIDVQTGFLTYRLPEQIGPGDVAILEPSGALSDGLRFFNSGGQ